MLHCKMTSSDLEIRAVGLSREEQSFRKVNLSKVKNWTVITFLGTLLS